MGETTGAVGEISGDVALSPQPIAIGDQTVETDGATGGKRLGADTHFGTEAVAESIGETGGTVVIDPGTVHSSEEAISRLGIGGDDRLGVPRAMASDRAFGSTTAA